MKSCANSVLAGNRDSTVLQQIAAGILRIEKREDGEGALIYKGWRRRSRFREKLSMQPYLE